MFQSLTGRLKTEFARFSYERTSTFQSLTGRLKTYASSAPAHGLSKFQSLTGRLKTYRRYASDKSGALGFNPSQVG